MKLERTLNLLDLIFVGYGNIIGAGIYTLLGFTTKYGRGNTWISFIIGGIISLMTGLSYANLSKKFNSNNGEYDYIKAIDKKLAKISVILLILTGAVMVSTLTLALSNYINVSIPKNIINLIIIAIPTIINISSVKHTSNINIVITILESIGLFLLIIFSVNKWNIPTLFKNNNGFPGILRGTFLTIFAYTGFQSLVKLNRESIKPKENIPKAIIYSIILATIIYVLVSISTVSILGIKSLSKSTTPISNSINHILGKNFRNGIDNIALISITSSILLVTLATSRQLQSISEQNIIPNYFKDINPRTKTPIKAILVVSILSYIFTFVKNVETSTTITNIFTFIIFMLVNLSSIVINYNENKNIPIYSVFGLISTTIMTCMSYTNKYLISN